VTGCCECGDEPLGSCAAELVIRVGRTRQALAGQVVEGEELDWGQTEPSVENSRRDSKPRPGTVCSQY
jgi:hypothetical protein